MAERHQASGPVQGGPKEVALPDLGAPGMNRHPHTQRPRRRPRVALERPLALDGSNEPRLGPVEGGQHTVAGRLDHRPARLLHGRSQQRVVGFERDAHGGRLLLPKPRAPLDVGQEERGGPGRGCRCHRRLAVTRMASILPAGTCGVKDGMETALPCLGSSVQHPDARRSARLGRAWPPCRGSGSREPGCPVLVGVQGLRRSAADRSATAARAFCPPSYCDVTSPGRTENVTPSTATTLPRRAS